MTDTVTNRHVEVIDEYFRLMDLRDPAILDLVTDDAEIGMPKYGVGRGKEAFHQVWGGFTDIGEWYGHTLLNKVFQGDLAVVEGLVSGRHVDGRTFKGGEGPGGRFCNVFEFRGDLISRVHVYLDPDYLGDDADRWRWGREGRTWK